MRTNDASTSIDAASRAARYGSDVFLLAARKAREVGEDEFAAQLESLHDRGTRLANDLLNESQMAADAGE